MESSDTNNLRQRKPLSVIRRKNLETQNTPRLYKKYFLKYKKNRLYKPKLVFRSPSPAIQFSYPSANNYQVARVSSLKIPLGLSKAVHTVKLNEQSPSLFCIQQPLVLKEKYSFFNNVFYKKGVLRKFYKQTIAKLYHRYTRLDMSALSYKFFRLSTLYFFETTQRKDQTNITQKN